MGNLRYYERYTSKSLWNQGLRNSILLRKWSKERSAFTVKHVFNEHYKKYMTPAEIQILTDLSNSYIDPRKTAFDEGSVRDITLYLRTNPTTCFQRKLIRRRPEEVGKKNLVDEEYLKELHAIHEAAISKSIGEVITADGTKFDPNDPKSVRILGSDEFVIDALIDIGKLDDDFNVEINLEDDWTPEGDRITRE